MPTAAQAALSKKPVNADEPHGARPQGRPRGRPRGKAAGPRQDNRRVALMDAAATLFAEQGYAATTIRDVAGAAGMLPGSLYYHFPSKAALLLAVYREGVAGLERRVDAAIAEAATGATVPGGDAWTQLEAAATAHLETVLDQSAYARVMIRVLPDDADDPTVRVELAAARDGYERRFRELIAGLGLAQSADAGRLRLMLLGALNWAQIWYRAGGASPAAIARDFVRTVRQGVSP